MAKKNKSKSRNLGILDKYDIPQSRSLDVPKPTPPTFAGRQLQVMLPLAHRSRTPTLQASKGLNSQSVNSCVISDDVRDELGEISQVYKDNIPFREILKALEKSVTHLATIGDPEDIEMWLQDHGIEDLEIIKRLQQSCQTISMHLRAKTAPKSPEKPGSRSPPDNLEEFQQFFIYRTPSSMKLVAPVEVFSGMTSLRRKTFGFVRRSGSYFPLMTSISGWEPAAKSHQKLLDSSVWTDEAFNFAGLYKFTFRGTGWDIHHKKRLGTEHASHAEVKLMIYYVCRVLSKMTNKSPNLKNLGMLRKLLKKKPQQDAEILLSEEPCFECWKFRNRIQDITGVRFNFTVVPSLGEISREKEKSTGRSIYPRYAFESSDESDENEAGTARNSRSSCIVEIPKQGETLFMQKVMSEASKPTKSARHSYNKRSCDDSDSEDSIPTTPPKKKAKQHLITPPQTTTRRRAVVLIPHSPLGYEGLERLKKPRKSSSSKPVRKRVSMELNGYRVRDKIIDLR